MADEPAPTDAGSSDHRAHPFKVRAAWLSFASRILAQIVGAVATVVFGLMFLQTHQARDERVNRAAVSPIVTQATLSTPVPARAPRLSGRPSIAVLPLEDLSDGNKPGHTSAAITESVIAALSQVDTLRVISRTSSMQYKGARKTIPEIARELRVDWILEGSLLMADGRVRMIGQLIDAASDEHVWTATFDRKFVGLLALQNDLASTVAREVEGAILGATRAARKVDVPPVAATSGRIP